MKIIIQCAGSKDPNAGSLRDSEDIPITFRATGPNAITKDWVDLLVDYNQQLKEDNPYQLYPCWQLYRPAVYSALCLEFGYQNIYILSAGWGLVRSDFLFPQYDVTFAQVPKAEKDKRRVNINDWPDLNQFTWAPGEETIVLCGQAYIPLLKKMISQWFKITGQRAFIKLVCTSMPTIQFSQDHQPGKIIHFPRTFTNWHYEAARQIIQHRGLPPEGFR